MTEDILLLGHPFLRKQVVPISFPWDEHFSDENTRLKRALEEFRQEKGFGRGIAAPQIGISKRLISLNLGEGPFSIINPVITQCSEETFTLWDDCMSFPDLLVKVERAVSITVEYRNECEKRC
jgi:peptide deformylase